MNKLHAVIIGYVYAVLFALSSAQAETLKVCASFSILGDMVSNVGGSEVSLSVLVGPGADAHEFHPSSKHARVATAAQIVFMNGRGFDEWAARLHQSSGSRAVLVRVADNISKRPHDPHVWQNVTNALAIVDEITSALSKMQPEKASTFEANAKHYKNELLTLHRQIQATIASVPKERRRVITTHDAFGFFADAYGVQFMAPIGISTHAQASAKSVAKLIAQIKREKISALFLESVSDHRLLTQIAKETSVAIGGTLYADALSAKTGPASTYLLMMRHNAKLLTEAMAKGS